MSIRVENLTKHIGQKLIVNDASLEIRPGKITVLLGANGAGKSSLMRAILALDNISQGKVLVDGAQFSALAISKRAQIIGYLAQNLRPEWNMRVYDLVGLGRIPLQINGATNRHKDNEAVQNALRQLEIEYLAQSLIHEISGGELALCLLARVIAGAPKYIFADEPLNHLDINMIAAPLPVFFFFFFFW